MKAVFSSDFLQGFPFELFGVQPEDLFGLATDQPERAAALIRALLDIGRTYDVQVEQFLLAALRSYQRMNANYFADLEEAAARFRAARGWTGGEALEPGALRRVLEEDFGYRLDFDTLAAHPDLAAQRSQFIDENAEFFAIATARPLALASGAGSSVSLGFLLDDHFKQTVRFWNDPAVPRIAVNLTCERCRLAESECAERAAPAHPLSRARGPGEEGEGPRRASRRPAALTGWRGFSGRRMPLGGAWPRRMAWARHRRRRRGLRSDGAAWCRRAATWCSPRPGGRRSP